DGCTTRYGSPPPPGQPGRNGSGPRRKRRGPQPFACDRSAGHRAAHTVAAGGARRGAGAAGPTVAAVAAVAAEGDGAGGRPAVATLAAVAAVAGRALGGRRGRGAVPAL